MEEKGILEVEGKWNPKEKERQRKEELLVQEESKEK